MTSDEAFRKAFPRGIPVCSVELKGIRVYDPRKDSTNGGSGSHRTADPTTWQWTGGGAGSPVSDIGRNPALCAATYMMMAESDGGMGYPPTRIDWASVAIAASICEEPITLGPPISLTMRRYQCDAILSTADKRNVNLEYLLASMQGVVVRVGSKFFVYAGAYDTPNVGMTITEDWLRGPASHATQDPIESLYNAVRVSFDHASKDYRPDEAPGFTDSSYETQDGGQRLWHDVNLRSVSDLYNAEYIAAVIGRRSRLQQSLELPLNLRGLQLKVWDTVTVTLPEIGVTSQVFRVMAWTWEDMGPRVTLREEAASIYDAGTATWATITASGALVETVTLPAPTLSATAVADGIVLVFEAPALSLVHVLELERSPNGSTGWTKIATIAAGNTQYKDPITDGGHWYYRIRAMTAKYQPGTYSNTAEATAKTVANGADVTAQMAQTPILNPGFEAGAVNWLYGGAWSIVNDISNCRSGTWSGRFIGSGSDTMTNDFKLGCAPGDRIYAHGFAKVVSGTASICARIVFQDINSNPIGTPYAGNAVSSGSYAQSRLAPASGQEAPANTAYAIFQFTIISSSSATVYVDDAYMTIMPRNVSEVPDGGGRSTPITSFVDGDGHPLVDLTDAHPNKIIDGLADGAYGRILISDLTGGVHRIGVSGSGYRIGDWRNMIQVGATGQAVNPTGTLVSQSNGTIDVVGHTLQLGGQSVPYTGVNDVVTGLSAGNQRWIACDDSGYAGGVRTWAGYTTAASAYAGDARYCLGLSAPIPTGADSGGGFGGGQCVAAQSWMTGTRKAKQIRAGDKLRCRADRGNTLMAEVENISFVKAPCVRILTEHGAALVCSFNTPFTLPNGEYRNAPDMFKGAVLVQRGLIRSWETVIDVQAVDELLEVARIHIGGRSYPAGESPEALIYSHNPLKP